jgi:hypothetical protein
MSEELKGAPAAGEAADGEEIEFAELHQGHMDPMALESLFRDLQACTEVLDVQIKGGAVHRAKSMPSLDQALNGLLAGRFRGVQVRYIFEGQQWWDTLIAQPPGARLVRMKAPDFPA